MTSPAEPASSPAPQPDAGRDQAAILRDSHAGIRLIALLTIYNRADAARYEQFLRDALHADLLALKPLVEWVGEYAYMQSAWGRVAVEQTLAIGKHQAVVAVRTERSGVVLYQIVVSDDYPHAITGLAMQHLET